MKIVKFGAEWCGPCRIQDRILEEISSSTDIEIIKVNVDDEPSLAEENGVQSVPTILIYNDNNEIINRFTGVVSAGTLYSTIS